MPHIPFLFCGGFLPWKARPLRGDATRSCQHGPRQLLPCWCFSMSEWPLMFSLTTSRRASRWRALGASQEIWYFGCVAAAKHPLQVRVSLKCFVRVSLKLASCSPACLVGLSCEKCHHAPQCSSPPRELIKVMNHYSVQHFVFPIPCPVTGFLP